MKPYFPPLELRVGDDEIETVAFFNVEKVDLDDPKEERRVIRALMVAINEARDLQSAYAASLEKDEREAKESGS